MDSGQRKTKRQTATTILTPYFEDEWISVYVGDVRDVLPKLLASLAAKDRPQMCISSPPYLGLRDYNTATWTGGDPDCDHIEKSRPQRDHNGKDFGEGRGNEAGKSATKIAYRDLCRKCGARSIDSQIGLEATPAEFTAAMVTVFDDCRSVLKDDGTLWLNIGDSYASNAGGYDVNGSRGATSHRAISQKTMSAVVQNRSRLPMPGMKPKDLMLMPFEVARALRDAGWWLRQAFPWTKRSAMPGSQEDRATTALEWIFQLAKKKHYFYDPEAIRMGRTSNEDAATFRGGCYTNGNGDNGTLGKRQVVGNKIVAPSNRDRSIPTNRNGEGGHLDETPSGSRGFRNTDLFYTQVDAPHGLIFAGDEIVGIDCNPAGFSGEYCTACKRYYHDARDKKEIAISYQPAAEGSEDKKQIRTCICGRSDAWLSHFATFPMKLVTPFIRCGTSEAGECSSCGKAWVRITDTEYHNTDSSTGEAWSGNGQKAAAAPNSTAGKVDVKTGDGSWTYAERTRRITSTLGFIPQCECDAPARPQTVLDPFGGAGTTMIVAAKLGRRCISIELNEEYAAMSIERYKREMRKPVDPPRREAPPLFGYLAESTEKVEETQ